jgi:putative oxidoreductase
VDWGVLFLRIPVGLTFIYHGYDKIATGITPFSEGLASMNIPAPLFFAYVVAIAEFVGGLCVLTGLFTPVSSAVLVVILIVAVVKVHLPAGFDMAKGGFEPHLAWIGILMFLILAGPGRYSVDRFAAGREAS